MSMRLKIFLLSCSLIVIPLVCNGTAPFISTACAGEAQAVYVCPQCGLEQANSGNCPKCNVPLAKQQISYECPSCGVSQVRAGNCSICGVALVEKKRPL